MSAVALPSLPATPHLSLYVDLDGTLLATDLLHESALRLLRAAPLSLLRWPGWLLRGKAYLKQRIAERVSLDAAALPYRPGVLELIRRARADGRRVVLVTASDRALAAAVAAHLGLFDDVIASDGAINLSGLRKLDAIRADAAGQPFCYMANETVDLDVWQGADAAVVVSNSTALRRRARAVTRIEAELDVPQATLRDLLYGIRVHQWLKNLLVFVPLLPMLKDVTAAMALDTVVMFVAFCACASAVYVVNDLLDLEADRQHPRKKRRPFASGLIPISSAVAIALALFGSAAALALALLPWPAVAVLLGYLLLTTTYSLWLKGKMLIDVFALAALYTTRILAGVAAAGVEASFWLLGFSMFLFLSLALAKRYVELGDLRSTGDGRVKGRAYASSDSVFVVAAGLAAGQISILTLSLYLNDPAVAARYAHPFVLWLLSPLLLYWLVRMWLKAHRHELDDDPVVFAARDGISRAIVLCCVLLVVVAS